MIVSFYSYKGGVGRSQLCANIAAYLFFQKDKRVLLWDWDFEAPGLHYFFGLRNENVNKNGTLELLEEYMITMRRKTGVTADDLKVISKEENIVPLRSSESNEKRGCIDLLAAGRYNEEFSRRSNDFDWFEFYSMLDGANYIELLKEKLHGLDYDYVLIDSRTGISDYSGICNIQLPDVNVIVVAPTMQNFEGSKNIMEKIINADYLKLKKRTPRIFPVLSRLDPSNPKRKEWMDRFADYFSSAIRNLDPEFDDAFLPEIFSDVYCTETFLPYTPAISAGENILFNHQSRTSRLDYARPFQNISELLESVNTSGTVSFYKKIDEDTWLEYAQKAKQSNQNRKAAIAYTQTGIKQKDAEAQIKYFNLAIDTDPDYFLSYNLAGVALLNNGKYDNAVEYLQKSAALNPRFVEAFFNLGLAYYSKKDLEKALENYEQAIVLKPDYAVAYFNMGIVYYDKEDRENAIKNYRKALSIQANDAESYNNLGVVYDEKGDTKAAIENYVNAITIRSDYYMAYNNLGVAYRTDGQPEKAIEQLKKALEIKPDFPDPYYNLGLIYYDQNNLALAIENFLSAAKLRPGFSEAYDAVGLAYNKQGDMDKAIVYYQMAIQQAPDFARSYFNLANAYNKKNENEKAIESYLKTIELQAGFADAYNNLGYVYIKTGEFEKALPVLEKAIEAGLTDHSNMNIGHLWLCKGDAEKALTYYSLSYRNFSNKDDFWKGLNDDVTVLSNCGVSTATIEEIKSKIKRAADATALETNATEASLQKPASQSIGTSNR